MANTEKKGGFFSRFKKDSTIEPPEKPPEAAPAKQTKPIASAPSPAKTAPAEDISEQTRSDVLEPVDTAASIEAFFKTMLSLSVEHLKMADNTIKAATENLDKLTDSLKGKQQ